MAPVASVTENPARLFTDDGGAKDSNDCFLIVLNQPIVCNNAFQRCYDKAKWRLYADGGADRVHRLSNVKEMPPHIILGDLDSLKPETREHYARNASVPVMVCHDSDQYSTDFGKAVKWVELMRDHLESPKDLADLIQRGTVQPFHETAEAVRNYRPSESTRRSISDVIVFSGLGGRVDQGIGLLSELAREEERSEGRLRFWLVSERSVSWVLHQNSRSLLDKETRRHIIQLSPQQPQGKALGDERAQLFSHNVGILPVFGRAQIGTQGLEWDVQDWTTNMGGQVSTSNHVASKSGVIEVETNARVLFTVEMGEGLRDKVEE